jgi:radical SAM superfamily enzyme YgiQ (UPF0313 family)
MNPPMNYGAYNDAGRQYLDRSYPPLGLGYLSAVLAKHGYEVEVFDFVDTSLENVEEILRNKRLQVVGISCNLTDYRWGAFKLAQIVKRINPQCTVVMGGSHATHLYEQILSNFCVDVVVRYEGEYTFLDVVKAIETGSKLEDIKGIAFKTEGGIVKNEDRLPISELDSLPFPTYDLFDVNNYIHYSSPATFAGKKVKKLKSASMMTSRGCPYCCQYCSITKFWRGNCRFRSVKKVVDEMELLRNKHGVVHFNFFDDAFTLNNDRVIEICKEIIGRELDVCWECVTRVDCVSSEMLNWMRRAGCVSISYGVESGSSMVLKTIKKRQTRSQIIKAFKMTHEAGISAYILLMIGNPNESKQSISETIELMRIIKPDKIKTTLTMIYPSTDLYELCKKRGLISDDYWLSAKAAPVYSAENSVRQLKQWESKITLFYYLQERNLLRVFQIILYRNVFKHIREIARHLGSRIDEQMEKIDHVFHQT